MKLRRLSPIAVIAGLALLSVADGCGSSDCAETATCGPSTADAGPWVDQSAEGSGEGSVAPGDGSDVNAVLADDAADAGEDVAADAEGGSDAPSDGAAQDAPADAPGDAGVDSPPEAAPGDASGACDLSAPDCSNPQCTASA